MGKVQFRYLLFLTIIELVTVKLVHVQNNVQ